MMNDFVDMVCVGEGEYPLLELVETMERGETNHSIGSIWFKENGKIIKNEIRNTVTDLDELPMPAKDLYYSKSTHFSKCYYIMASRGCAYSCSFCFHSYMRELTRDKGKYLRFRSVDKVISELKMAKEKYNIKSIRFFDDSLGSKFSWLEEFSIKYPKS